jgi:6-phosphogluconate dehydrogenase
MKLGFIGLGKMGSQLVKKMLDEHNEVIIYDVNQEAIDQLVQVGATSSSSYQDLVEKLGENPVVWLMIPVEFVSKSIEDLQRLMPSGSLLIDGGNSNFQDSISRSAELSKNGIEFMDIGTSGGILGFKDGFCLMVGGQKSSYERVSVALDSLCAPRGRHAFVGPVGSGHFVKMAHNAIEYGMMQSLAEGYHLLREGPINNIPIAEVAELWQHGSIIKSTLNELCAEIFEDTQALDEIDGFVADTGEGRWASIIASQSDIDLPALNAALQVRNSSQSGTVNFSTKVLASLRNKFGGHPLKKDTR